MDARHDRFPPIPEGQMTEAQKQAAKEFEQERGVPIFGPFWPLLRSPKLLSAANPLGMFCRYGSTLPRNISELLMLITANAYNEPVEWSIHYPIALQLGIPEAALVAIKEGKEPTGLEPNQMVAWRLSTELHAKKSVSDSTWKEAITTFGDEGVMDILGVLGYYTFLATVMNAAQTAPPSK